MTGPERVAIRDLAHAFGRRFGKKAIVVGQEAPTAWLNDSSEAQRLFGPPEVTLTDMIDWTADWLLGGGRSLGKPTHYETRDGHY